MRAITRVSIKEFIRNKILLGIIFMAVAIIFGSVVISSLALSEREKIIIDFSFSAMEFFALITTLFLGSYLIWNELSKNTILLILSKNPSRKDFILWKFLGFSVLLLIELAVMFLAFLIVALLYHIPLNIYYWVGSYFIFLKMEVILAFVLFFSTFVSPFIALFGAIGVYFISHSTSFIKFFAYEFNKWWALERGITSVLYYIFPNFQSLSLKEYFLSPYLSEYNWIRVWMNSLEAMFFVLVLLLWAIWIFNQREF